MQQSRELAALTALRCPKGHQLVSVPAIAASHCPACGTTGRIIEADGGLCIIDMHPSTEAERGVFARFMGSAITV